MPGIAVMTDIYTDYRYPTDAGIPIQMSHIQPSLRDSNLRSEWKCKYLFILNFISVGYHRFGTA